MAKDKPVVVKDDPNPWLKIEHEHEMLPATSFDGERAEKVCGLCGLREPAE